MYQNSKETFQEAEGEDQALLQFFSFICSLSLDVYVKKLLIEKLIDEMPAPAEEKETKDKKKKKEAE